MTLFCVTQKEIFRRRYFDILELSWFQCFKMIFCVPLKEVIQVMNDMRVIKEKSTQK